jgi:hypothetical protein
MKMAITETVDGAERINARLSQILAGEFPDDLRVWRTINKGVGQSRAVPTRKTPDPG